MKHSDLGYATKVWLTGVLVPAVFWGLTGELGIFGVSIVLSGGFSIPSWLVLWAAVRLINRQVWDVEIKKTVLCLIGTVLTGLAWALLGWAVEENPMEMFSVFGWGLGIQLGYAAAICLGVVYFDLPERNPEISEEPTDHLHNTND